jgi:hypothetical protein
MTLEFSFIVHFNPISNSFKQSSWRRSDKQPLQGYPSLLFQICYWQWGEQHMTAASTTDGLYLVEFTQLKLKMDLTTISVPIVHHVS